MMNLLDFQNTIFDEYIRNGYLDRWNRTIPERDGDLGELAKIVTEVSEAIVEVSEKETDLEKLAKECADIIIRTVNFMSRKGIDLEKALMKAHNKNLDRGHLHGKEIQ